MKSEFVVLAVVVSLLAAAVLLVLWLQKPDPLSGAGVEALAERQAASAPPVKKNARRASARGRLKTITPCGRDGGGCEAIRVAPASGDRLTTS